MSTLAMVIVAWAALYTYACSYYFILYRQQRTVGVYRAFALVEGSLGVYAVGAICLAMAEAPGDALLGMKIKAAGLIACIAFSVDFSHELLGKGDPRITKLAYAWAAAGLLATALGLLFDAQTLAPPPTWGFAAAPDLLEPALSPLGQLFLIAGWAFGAYGGVRLVPKAGADQTLTLILISWTANLLAGAHDILIYTLSLRSVPLMEHSAVLSSLVMSYLLLTRFVHTSSRLAQRRRELRRSYDDLRVAQAELVQKQQLAAVGELSAVIAHEVRNPLSIIKNAVSGLRRRDIAAQDQNTLLEILDEETDRLYRLVDDLLAYSRPLEPRGRPTGVAKLVKRSIELAKAGAEDPQGITIEVHLEDGPDSVHADPDLLGHAFMNIIINAMQAMPSGGNLEVRAQEGLLGQGPALSVHFIDTGEGMDRAVREKALDPFFTTRPTGTGLGLAIVERVIANHGGQLHIQSESGVGTTVSVLVPVRRSRIATPSSPHAFEPPGPP